VHTLEECVEVTLSNLIIATKTHTTSSGLSPVSLLNAAASHVSAAITELGHVVLLQHATKAEQDYFAPSSSSTRTGTHATNGFVPVLCTVEEVRSSATHQCGLSESSSWWSDRERELVRNEREQPVQSESSSDDSSATPMIFDQSATNGTGVARPDLATGEGSEDAWTELRVCSLVFYASRVACSRRVCVYVISSHT
jgi:protein SPA2